MVQEGIIRSALRKNFLWPNVCQNRRLRSQILVRGSTVPPPGTMENAIFAHFRKKSNYSKAEYFVTLSNLVLASERTKSRKHFVVKWIGFDRFMTSEGIKTLILNFTLKTGQHVERIRHRIF